MTRAALLSGAVSSVVSAVVTVLLLTLAIPALAGAQEARYPLVAVSIPGSDGTERIRLGAGPGFFAGVRVLSPDGGVRTEMATGGPPEDGGIVPAGAGVNVRALDGTPIVHLGTGRGGIGSVLDLNDKEGRSRVILRVAADGTPSIELLDVDGNAVWSAP